MPSKTTTTITTAAALAVGLTLGVAAGAGDKPPALAKEVATVAAIAPTKSEVKTEKEKCSGLANPVDYTHNGVANENFPLLGQHCDGADEDVAACGVYVCNETGTAVTCAETEVPRVEWCDGLDNDCDGSTDEGFHIDDSCVNGLGECKRYGKIVCADDAQSSVCNAVAGDPIIEAGALCSDRRDNDCDGLPDGCDSDCPGSPCPIGRVIR